MDANLKRSIILEHYQNPKNKGLIEDDTYIFANTNNESCIDEINLMVKVKDGILSLAHASQTSSYQTFRPRPVPSYRSGRS